MPIHLLARALRRHRNPPAPDFGTRDLLVSAAALTVIGGLSWLAYRDIKATAASATTTPTVEPDRPGPRPEPVFPAEIETKKVGVDLILSGEDPHPAPLFVDATDSDVSLSPSGSRMDVVAMLPVDVEVSIVTLPGGVISSPSGQYQVLVQDIGIASSTKLKGATLVEGLYGMSPKMLFRISSPAQGKTVADANVILQIQYSWKDQGGTLRSDTIPLAIFAG